MLFIIRPLPLGTYYALVLSICSFVCPIIPEWKIIKTLNLIEVFSLTSVIDNAVVCRQLKVIWAC